MSDPTNWYRGMVHLDLHIIKFIKHLHTDFSQIELHTHRSTPTTLLHLRTTTSHSSTSACISGLIITSKLFCNLQVVAIKA
jgi:hypothetical protein